MEKVKSEDNINNHCKKLFAPETKDFPVTESKKNIKKKLVGQLVKYGDYVCSKKFSNRNADLCGIVIDSIENCLKKWSDGLVCESYSAFFAKDVYQRCRDNFRKKKVKIIETASSLEAPINFDDSNKTLKDTIEAENESSEELCLELDNLFGKEGVLPAIDHIFRLKPRDDWFKAMLTATFYDELHIVYSKYPDKKKFSFVDIDVYNMSEKPKDKDIAFKFAKDATQISRTKKKFLESLKEMEDVKNLWDSIGKIFKEEKK